MKNNYCGKRVCRFEKIYVKALSAGMYEEWIKNEWEMQKIVRV